MYDGTSFRSILLLALHKYSAYVPDASFLCQKEWVMPALTMGGVDRIQLPSNAERVKRCRTPCVLQCQQVSIRENSAWQIHWDPEHPSLLWVTLYHREKLVFAHSALNGQSWHKTHASGQFSLCASHLVWNFNKGRSSHRNVSDTIMSSFSQMQSLHHIFPMVSSKKAHPVTVTEIAFPSEQDA